MTDFEHKTAIAYREGRVLVRCHDGASFDEGYSLVRISVQNAILDQYSDEELIRELLPQVKDALQELRKVNK